MRLIFKHQGDLTVLTPRFLNEAAAALLALADEPYQPRGYRVLQLVRKPGNVDLNLEGCYALSFSGESYDESFRIVYVIHEEQDEVEVLAIGRRQGSHVYRLAQARLREQAALTPLRRPMRTWRMRHEPLGRGT